MTGVLFTFDFIVKNVRELRESDDVRAVEFKLLDFPSVSVALGPRKTREQRKRTLPASRRHAEGASTRQTAVQRADSNRSIRKGKSVTFRMHPTELFRDLRMVPLKVRLQRSSVHRENSRPIKPLKHGVTLTDEGVLDLSEMATSVEALVAASEKLHKKGQSPIKHCKRGSIEIKSDATTTVTKLHVKYRLVCFRDEEGVHHNMSSEITPKGMLGNGRNGESAHVVEGEQDHPSSEEAEERMSLKISPPFSEPKAQSTNLNVGHIHVDDGESVIEKKQGHLSLENVEKDPQSANLNAGHLDYRDDQNSESVIEEEQDHSSSENVEKMMERVSLMSSPLSEPKPQSGAGSLIVESHMNDNASLQCTENDQNRSNATIVHSEENHNTHPPLMYDECGLKSSTTTVHSHTSSSDKEVYIPNSVCPPPLYYHSKQDTARTQRTVSYWKPPPMSSVPCSTDEVWCESVAHTEGYSDWSVLAQYDQTSSPITTQLKNKKRYEKAVDKQVTDNPDIVRNLPLLSLLMEEISCLNSQLFNRTAEKREPKRVSTSSQTEEGLKPETRLVRQQKVREQRVRKSEGRGGGFVRQCCKAVISRKTLVPSSKSVLYAPDITHKQKHFLSRKKTKGVRFAGFPQRTSANHKEQDKAVQSHEQALSHTDTMSFMAPSNIESVQPINSTPTVKLNVYVPTTHHGPAPLSSPPSVLSSTSSLTMVRREMTRVNVETQTEGIANREEEKDKQKVTTTREQSVQTEEGEQVRNETWKSEAATSSSGGETANPPFSTHTPIEPASLAQASSVLVQPAGEEEGSQHHSTKTPTSSPILPLRDSSCRLQDRRQSDAAQSLAKFRSSRQFSSMGDIRTTLPESPLLHSTTLHTGSAPENTLKSVESQTLDGSFMSTDNMVAAVEERGVLPLLSKHHRDGIVFLATSQCSLPSYRGDGGQFDELGVGVSTETVEACGEDDYSDDFEDSDSLEESSSD